MFNIGPQELFWLFLIVLLIFGAKRIPEIGRSVGRGIQEFKKGMRDVENELQVSDKPAPAPPPPPAATPREATVEDRKV
ncbi:MAG TPA: twin-arginine translocase TatA/TatE family subunit [Candidatus Binatia bacterium]|nr:twin-arginine translocase TatA/TatE family subunit [Candidatus Binatia bacterium]